MEMIVGSTYSDKFFTSLKRAQELHKLRINLTGTIMANREGCISGVTKIKLKGKLENLMSSWPITIKMMLLYWFGGT